MADGGPVLGSGGCIHHLLMAQARATPRAPAVAFEDGATLSYAELDSRSTAVMRVLRRLGVREEALVGVRLPRCVGAVVGMVGVLKTAGAYVAIDTCFPPDRQAHILQESKLRVLLVPRGGAPRARAECGPAVAVVELGPMGELFDVWPSGAQAPTEAEAGEEEEDGESKEGRGGDGDDEEEGWEAGAPQSDRTLAYILYTSGSTGKPKGVMVEHRGVVSLLHFFQRRLRLGAGHTVLGLTTFCFDISVLELFLPLATGARLCLASAQTQRDPLAILDALEREKVTVLQATPATFELLMVAGWAGHPAVHCICGGEAFRLNLLPLAKNCASITNGYGPTEATIYTTTYTLPGGDAALGLADVPIGGALPGLRLYVLGEDLQPKPVGEPGELWVAGAGVARGYLHRADLTAERFVPDPFFVARGHGQQGEPSGMMMYKTGDEVKWVPDPAAPGSLTLAYLGRMDSQVKLNGFRIELGELERVLQQHEKVGGAVVCCRDDVPGRAKALVAYVVPAAAHSPPTAGELRVHLARAVPPYMVCEHYVVMEAFPLSPNGKVDRKALPPPVAPLAVDSGGSSSSSDDKTSGFGSSLAAGVATARAATARASSSEPSVLSLSIDDEEDEESGSEEEEDDDEELGKRRRTRRGGGNSSSSGPVRLVSRLVREQSGAEVDAASSMTAIGLDSLGMAVILARLSAALGGMRVPPAAIFEHETVGEFADYLARRVAAERPDLAPSLLGLGGRPRSPGPGSPPSKAHVSSLGKPLKKTTAKVVGGGGGSFGGGALTAAASSAAGSVASLTASLTGLRGVLILWVVAEHFVSRADWAFCGYRFSYNTYFFILLSGFTAALQASGSAQGKWRWRSFLASKALGLFPIYYAAILLSLPRYLAITRDPVAYSGPAWTKTGVLRTDYQSPGGGWWTYAVDALFLLTGMQTWVEEVNHRAMNPLYYPSVQWNLYLFFALAWPCLWRRPTVQWLARWERAVGGPVAAWLLASALLLGSLALACYVHLHYLLNHWPVLYLPSFVCGMHAARLYLHLRPRVARVSESLLATTAAAESSVINNTPSGRAPPTPAGGAREEMERRGWERGMACLPSAAALARARAHALGFAWARSGDLLAALLLFLVCGPFGTHQLDRFVALFLMPLAAAAFVLVTCLQGSQHKSWLKRWVLESDWAGALGRLAFAIYLLHEAIGDVYMQMGVKGLFQQWGSLLPPPGVSWTDKYYIYVLPWMSTQSYVVKFAALALAVVVGWLLQHYLADQAVMWLVATTGDAWRWLRRPRWGWHHQQRRRRRQRRGQASGDAAAGASGVGTWMRRRLQQARKAGRGAQQLEMVEATVLSAV